MKAYLVVVGRRWLNRQYPLESKDEFFAWTPGDASLFSRSDARNVADEFAESFPSTSVFVAHKNRPFLAIKTELVAHEDDEAGGMTPPGDDE